MTSQGQNNLKKQILEKITESLNIQISQMQKKVLVSNSHIIPLRFYLHTFSQVRSLVSLPFQLGTGNHESETETSILAC